MTNWRRLAILSKTRVSWVLMVAVRECILFNGAALGDGLYPLPMTSRAFERATTSCRTERA